MGQSKIEVGGLRLVDTLRGKEEAIPSLMPTSASRDIEPVMIPSTGLNIDIFLSRVQYLWPTLSFYRPLYSVPGITFLMLSSSIIVRLNGSFHLSKKDARVGFLLGKGSGPDRH